MQNHNLIKKGVLFSLIISLTFNIYLGVNFFKKNDKQQNKHAKHESHEWDKHIRHAVYTNDSQLFCKWSSFAIVYMGKEDYLFFYSIIMALENNNTCAITTTENALHFMQEYYIKNPINQERIRLMRCYLLAKKNEKGDIYNHMFDRNFIKKEGEVFSSDYYLDELYHNLKNKKRIYILRNLYDLNVLPPKYPSK